MGFYKRPLSGIYRIEHSSGYYYIGMSVDIFSRWGSHYSDIKLDKHSSTKFLELWNSTNPNEWSFSILVTLSKTQFKKDSGLKGKPLKDGFRKELLRLERLQMSIHSINYSLNKDSKYFS